jgi:hypothetical protein
VKFPDQRQGRSLLGRVSREAQHCCEVQRSEVQVTLRAGGRVDEIDGSRTSLQRVTQRPVSGERIAEAFGTGHVVGAAFQNREQCVLRVEGNLRTERLLGRDDAVHNYRASVIRKASQIVFRDSRSIRGPIEIDALVAEHVAHAIEIANGDARRVIGNVRMLAQLGEAARRFGFRLGRCRAEEFLVIE